jgi:hypothetical protein
MKRAISATIPLLFQPTSPTEISKMLFQATSTMPKVEGTSPHRYPVPCWWIAMGVMVIVTELLLFQATSTMPKVEPVPCWWTAMGVMVIVTELLLFQATSTMPKVEGTPPHRYPVPC